MNVNADGTDVGPDRGRTAGSDDEPTPTTGKSGTRSRGGAGGPSRLVRFKIVGPLLIQPDIIGGVCYLHTLVRRALLVQDRITKKNMENLFGRS